MFKVPSIKQIYKTFKQSNKCTWKCERNFISQKPPTCCGHSCGHPQNNTTD